MSLDKPNTKPKQEYIAEFIDIREKFHRGIHDAVAKDANVSRETPESINCLSPTRY